ncbi:prepilin-type N-terminal cleavage/methylation domain-containing protein [Massilia sp. IC2-476]|uniref:type IV pilus modification PilV family protein n=1 Tax=Massilia sp. IC2-476 TaxID=2887199 RepID=UPI001D118060|nr:prepilin-type N-terminal cleavage/methylation domain-containing protein [Massilia sp. IC2-476]MCC2972685.1 prepilin-type N-terminal cleavage/methylation domain-containing protein [Massilia sp. IC2-476]
MFSRRMAGVTLVELIIAIVIVSAALGGLVAAFTRANRASVDPVITQQMLAIGESMMEEVLLKPYDNVPDEVATPTRAQFNDLRDFDNIDDASPGYASTGIRDVEGVAIAGLERYSVSVRVNEVALTGVAAGDALRVTVTVTNGTQQLTLTGWRTRPWT